MSRNKKSVCIDLRTEEGRKIIKKLAENSDVLIENFKPGTMEKWGLGPGKRQQMTVHVKSVLKVLI